MENVDQEEKQKQNYSARCITSTGCPKKVIGTIFCKQISKAPGQKYLPNFSEHYLIVSMSAKSREIRWFQELVFL